MSYYDYKVNTLMVVAHPDDEILMAGGFLKLKKQFGEKVAVVTLAANAEARSLGVQTIAAQQERVFEELGVSLYKNFDFPDSELAQVSHLKLVQAIENCILAYVPYRVITHFPGDNHMDHKCVSQACQEAIRIVQRISGGCPVMEFLYGEVPSSTDWGLGDQFHPNSWNPISERTLEEKIRLLEMYQEVIRDNPHPRSKENLTALARCRGAQAGFQFAEAFQQVFRIM